MSSQKRVRHNNNIDKNKKTSNMEITAEIEILLNMVETRSYIFDPSNSMYSNRELRKSAWSEIGFQIGISAKEAQDKYTYLRDQYTRKKNEKKASGSGRKRNSKNDAVEKQFMQRLSFLSGFVKSKRSTTGNYDSSGNDSEDNEDDTAIESQVLSTSDDEVLESNPSKSGESSAPAQSLKTPMRCKKRKINKQDEDVQNRILKVLEGSDDEEELFGASVGAALKKFSPRKKALAKLKIQSVLYEITMETGNVITGGQNSSEPDAFRSVQNEIQFENY